MTYIFKQDSGLWYPVTAVAVDVGGRTVMTLEVGDEGIASPPPHIPGSGEPIITPEQYMAMVGVTQLPNPQQWMAVALAVSDHIESYCCRVFRGQAVPYALQLVAARMIAAEMKNVNKFPGIRSESWTGYSYQADGDILLALARDLAPYRTVFLGM